MAYVNHLQFVEAGPPAIDMAARKAADTLVQKYVAEALAGDTTALFDLGVAFSTGGHGVYCDLIEAHKWFNLAAARGHSEAQVCRAEISDEMTAREIVEAQKQARAWLAEHARPTA